MLDLSDARTVDNLTDGLWGYLCGAHEVLKNLRSKRLLGRLVDLDSLNIVYGEDWPVVRE